MLEKETKELVISEELKRKIEIICRFACKKYNLGEFMKKEKNNMNV